MKRASLQRWHVHVLHWTHTHIHTHKHTHIYTHMCTHSLGWLPFRIPGLTLIFKWLLLLPQDFQSISGHVLRWREIAREEKPGRMQTGSACVRVRVRWMGWDGRKEHGGKDDVNDNGGWGQRENESLVEAALRYLRERMRQGEDTGYFIVLSMSATVLHCEHRLQYLLLSKSGEFRFDKKAAAQHFPGCYTSSNHHTGCVPFFSQMTYEEHFSGRHTGLSLS